MTKDSVKNLKNIHNRASKKNIIATFALDILMATADTYVAVSQLLEVGFSWLASASLFEQF